MSNSSAKSRRFLIGLGNYCACDDAIGPRLIEHVAEQGLERGFRAIDLSGNPLNLLAYLEPATACILIVDCARMGLRPGDCAFFKARDVETQKRLAGMSTHEADALKILDLARQMKYRIPPMTFMGIEPKTTRSGIGLSRALESRLPEYAAIAARKLCGG